MSVHWKPVLCAWFCNMVSDVALLHDGDYVTVDVCSISCQVEELYANLAILKARTIEPLCETVMLG